MFDKNCWMYWCDNCGREQTINYATSSDEVLVLGCKKCGSERKFQAMRTASANAASTAA